MTTEQPPPVPTGPFLTAALICQQVLQEKDGVLSVIRIIDQLTHTIVARQMPEELPKVPFNLTFLISFKSGRARGRHSVVLGLEDPSGTKKELFAHSLQLEGEHRGANWVIQASITFEMEGLYWFEVFLEDRLVTRMPLRLVYQLVSPGAQQQSR